MPVIPAYAGIHLRSRGISREGAMTRTKGSAPGGRRRHHLHPSVIQRAMARAVQFRHAPAGERGRHPDGAGVAGAHDVKTTMLHTHVLNRGGLGVRSPRTDWTCRPLQA